jgi:hypothetical protein
MKVLLLAALAAVMLVPAAFAATPILNGTDGPGFTITLKKAGVKVTKLKAGTYLFKIADKSSIHNFHLIGPGIDKKTAVGFQGNVTWKLTLKKGTYKFMCDPHRSFMKVSFTVS